MEYLDFELPIKEIQEQLSKCEVIGSESEIDVTDTCAKLELKLKKNKRKNIRKFNTVAKSSIIQTSLKTIHFRLHKGHMWKFIFGTSWR